MLFYFCEELTTQAGLQILCMLNLLDVTSEFFTVTMFVFVDLQPIYCTWWVGIFMLYLYTKFHMLRPNSLLVIAFEPKVNENICMAAMMLFYILQKITLIKVAYFLKICYHTLYQNLLSLNICCVIIINF
jgi:hypothetical protein